MKIKSALNVWILGSVISSSVSSSNVSLGVGGRAAEEEAEPEFKFNKAKGLIDSLENFWSGRKCKSDQWYNCNTLDFEFNSTNFFFVRRPVTNWFTALKVCLTLGGFLAVGRTQAELNHFAKKIRGITPTNFEFVHPWLAVHDILRAGKFQTFINNEHHDFVPGDVKWAGGFPKSHANERSCVWSGLASRGDNYLQNHPCHTEKSYMCQMP